MNQRKSKTVRLLAASLVTTQKDAFRAHCMAKAKQKNTNGGEHHLRINPARQAKRLVLRNL